MTRVAGPLFACLCSPLVGRPPEPTHSAPVLYAAGTARWPRAASPPSSRVRPLAAASSLCLAALLEEGEGHAREGGAAIVRGAEALHKGGEAHGGRPAGGDGEHALAREHAEVEDVCQRDDAQEAVGHCLVSDGCDREQARNVDEDALARVGKDEEEEGRRPLERAGGHLLGGEEAAGGRGRRGQRLQHAGQEQVHKRFGEEGAADTKEEEVGARDDERQRGPPFGEDAHVGHLVPTLRPPGEADCREGHKDAEVDLQRLGRHRVRPQAARVEGAVVESEEEPAEALAEAGERLDVLWHSVPRHGCGHHRAEKELQPEDAERKSEESSRVTLKRLGLVSLHHLGRKV
mmetsp:Transcript_13698/g.44193  ORF Transcript_13698/g.44193 Transcript_13698/m.44193 type:complete len:347 (-) Transcript_13698:100-1140(-)